MAKISLRAYNQDIENLIDHNQIEEAIAHCKYILQQFPKHLDTYRLLGKIYLESRRYTEAADILQRVLSSIPDDFISQLGMSIIREDEGNLDAAIWHMERAFEIQPSNTAVQDELRRLYGRRDGVEPPKVRLTRGALVRMYARGELYPQAIAEARSALSEDPRRIDIEIILARMYFLSNQKVEATEVCSRLVSKLPYCYEANRILAEILPGTTRAEDAKTYQQTLSALNPYAAFVSDNVPTPDQVPDTTVTLERMVWEPGAEIAEQPAWASTLGIAMEKEPEEEIPSWLSAVQEAKAADQSQADIEDFFAGKEQESLAVEAPAEGAPEEEDVLPDWMRSAGWSESTGDEAEAAQPPFGAQEEEPLPADIPDWLQSLAPQSPEPPSGEEEQERLALLANLLPESGDDAAPAEPLIPAAEEPAEEEAPTPEEETELPAWLRNIGLEPSPGAQEESPESAGWSPFETEPTADFPPATAAPEPLAEAQVETPQPGEVGDSAEQAPESFESAAQPVTGGDSVLPPGIQDLDSAMAWLESLAVQQGADEETLLTPPEQRPEAPPEWILEGLEQSPAEEAPAGAPQEAVEAEAESVAFRPDLAEAPEASTEIEAQPSGEAAPAMPDLTDEAAAFAWLESLAAQQGADEETLLTRPEERVETPPEWVFEEADTEAAPVAEPALKGTEPPAETPIALQPEVETAPEQEPAVLAGDESPFETLAQAEEETTQEAETPAWLEEVTTPPAEAHKEDELLDWFEELSQETPQSEAPAAAPAETGPEAEAPDWLQALKAEVESPFTETGAETPAWLHELEAPLEAAAPGAEETAIEPAPKPEEALPAAEASPALAETMPAAPEWDEAVAPAPVELRPEIAETTEEVIQEVAGLSQEHPPAERGQTGPAVEPPATPAPLHQEAFALLESGQVEEALEQYNRMIESEENLEEIIHDLRNALDRRPVDISIWQALGDAYLRNNQIQDALDSYTKAEELLR